MEPTTTMMRLSCIIPSIPGSDVFSINVRGDQTVDELKVKIKEKTAPTFKYLPASSLELYKINIKLFDTNKSKEIMHDLCQPNHVFNPKNKPYPPRHIDVF